MELQGTAPLFCCWLVKDLLHGQQASATRTRLLLASLPSSTHSACEHPGPSPGEVGVCGLLCLAVAFLCGRVFLSASLSLCLFLLGQEEAFKSSLITCVLIHA